MLAPGPLSLSIHAQDRGAGAEGGAKLYQRLCSSCHGEQGEGVKGEYSSPLTGDKSIPQLTRYIEKWMPEDAPRECVGEEAERVARHIYDAFYSPIAQARNRPPRVDLTRLTVRQYRNAVMDLLLSFGDSRSAGDVEGLEAEYYDSRRPGRDRVLRRIDQQVKFDFDKQNPDEEKLGVEGFSARWEGSLVATETGEHEIIVHCDHALRLWVNDREKPLIDAWVKSGDNTKFRGSIFLVGGRAYPLRLEFSSRQQGVRKDKDKPERVPAFIELHWKTPHGVEQVIPPRHLRTQQAPESFVVETPFPPDDRSVGYERGTSISRAWEEATTSAAIEVATYITDHLERLSGVRDSDGERASKLKEFCLRFVERAFRRPVSDAMRSLYIERQFDQAPNLDEAVKRVVLMTLKSPRFLYLDFGGDRPDGYTVASRLSFALWDSLPDDELLQAAAAGELSSMEAVRAHAERRVTDPRARSKLRHFLRHWLEFERGHDMSKDGQAYPGFDKELAADLRTSLELFLEDVLWGEGGDFRQLLLSRELYANGRIAKFYGLDLPADAPFQKVRWPEDERLGVLGHPYLLSSFAYTDVSSPIHRGVFIVRGLLGRILRPPPDAFAPLSPDLHPDLTTRERVELQTKPRSCQSCHAMINSAGFPLEHFDAVGRFREAERGKPIDASGAYERLAGDTVQFDGTREFAEFLARSGEVHRAFVVQVFHHLVKQPILAYGTRTPADLQHAFESSKFNVRKLMAEIATTAALAGRIAVVEAPSRDLAPGSAGG